MHECVSHCYDTNGILTHKAAHQTYLIDTKLGISLGNGSLETTPLGRDKKKSNVGGGGSGNHVFDVILVTRSIDDSVVVLVGEELLGVALNGDTTFTLFLAGIEVVSKAKGRLALFLSRFLKLGHFTIRNSSKLEDQVAASGRLAGIDVSADNEREMFLSFRRHGDIINAV